MVMLPPQCFFGIVVELDGGGAVIMRINVDADVVAGNMVCLFDTLVEVLDVQRVCLDDWGRWCRR